MSPCSRSRTARPASVPSTRSTDSRAVPVASWTRTGPAPSSSTSAWASAGRVTERSPVRVSRSRSAWAPGPRPVAVSRARARAYSASSRGSSPRISTRASSAGRWRKRVIRLLLLPLPCWPAHGRAARVQRPCAPGRVRTFRPRASTQVNRLSGRAWPGRAFGRWSDPPVFGATPVDPARLPWRAPPGGGARGFAPTGSRLPAGPPVPLGTTHTGPSGERKHHAPAD